MPTYTKLFNSIVTSTIWTEDDKTRIVWITMLAMADKNGEVHASVPGLARISGVALGDCEKALNKLLSPDPYSRTPAFDGRRITPIDGGWELLNHAKYRAMASKEDAKAATAARVKRLRGRNANVTQCNGDVTVGNADVTQDRDIADTEAEANTEAEAKEKENSNEFSSARGRTREGSKTNRPTVTREEFDAFFREIGLYPRDAEATWNKWEGNGWTNKGQKIVSWEATVRAWKASGYMPSQQSPSDYEVDWSNANQSQPEPEQDDLMASFLRLKEAEAREAAGDHPDYWTDEEAEKEEEAGCF
jgi:hypothetical protein